jgi:Flp pilus assembly protein TadG
MLVSMLDLRNFCRSGLHAVRNARAFAGLFLHDARGSVSVALAFLAPVVIGSVGLAVEASYWQMHQREMQNAADSAAIAAAMEGNTHYQSVGKGVAAQYGFVDGTGNIAVAVSKSSSATGCTSNCYAVAISDQVRLFLSPVVGYHGDSTVNDTPATSVDSGAVATQVGGESFCILALATSGAQGITTNGAPKSDLQHCNVMSDTTATCNGHNLDADFGVAHGTNNGCGNTQVSGAPVVTDPYSGLASNIPSDPCGGSYPQEPAKKKDPALPAANQWSGAYSSLGAVKVVCGDQQLTGNTTISSNTVLVVENGQLDTNGYTLTGSSLTIVFSGTNSSSYQHVPTGGGTLNIAAPTSGAWSGVAIYQNPSLTTNVNISAAGNSPTWNLSGLVYLPHSSVTFSGAVNKSSTGQTCFAMVVDNITINGTASIFANDSQCPAAGLTMPQGAGRGKLVN